MHSAITTPRDPRSDGSLPRATITKMVWIYRSGYAARLVIPPPNPPPPPPSRFNSPPPYQSYLRSPPPVHGRTALPPRGEYELKPWEVPEGRWETFEAVADGPKSAEADADGTNMEDQRQTENPVLPRRFYYIFSALCVSTFLSAMDVTAVSTALPAIAAHYASPLYSWIGSSYALTSTVFLPWIGGIANIVGRRDALLGSLVLFAVGSAICGAAPTMATLLAGRSVQGVGGGGILVLTEIIMVDLIPLSRRGFFFGIIGGVWSLASAIGPPLGGALASANAWRWLFWMNLPICGVSVVLVSTLLKLKKPEGTRREALAKMDWLNLLWVPSSTAAILGITWAGTEGWSSPKVLASLCTGLAGMGAFLHLERSAQHPTVPFAALSQSTALIGHFSNCLHGLVVTMVYFYLPAYFQAAKGSSAVKSGVQILPIALSVSPSAIVAGSVISATSSFKLLNIAGFALLSIATGVFMVLRPESSTGVTVGCMLPWGIGGGILYSSVEFVVLSPISPSLQPAAMSFFTFTRSFAQVVGIAVGGTALQSRLNTKLPAPFLALLGGEEGSRDVAYASIPLIPSLESGLRHEVQVAFVDALKLVWLVGLGLACAGALLSVFVKESKLATTTDEQWGFKEPEGKK